jgi:hypothetical protein
MIIRLQPVLDIFFAMYKLECCGLVLGHNTLRKHLYFRGHKGPVKKGPCASGL